MPLAKDVNQGLPPLPPLLPLNWDAVMLNDNFKDGINGWHTHTGSMPPGLTDHSFGDSPHAMKLSTGQAPNTQTGGTNSIYKRLGRIADSGFLFWGGWFCFRGASEHSSPSSLGFVIDHQKTDDSGRSFGRLRLRRFTTGPETFDPRWSLTPDQIPVLPPANTFVDIPGSFASDYPVTAGKGAVPGWNLNHAGWWFAGLLMSINDSDNVSGKGIGRYWRAYALEQAFDISTLNTNYNQTMPGCGAENPQIDTGFGGPNNASSFSGGVNVGLTISNRGIADGPSALIAGHVFAVHYPLQPAGVDLFPIAA